MTREEELNDLKARIVEALIAAGFDDVRIDHENEGDSGPTISAYDGGTEHEFNIDPVLI